MIRTFQGKTPQIAASAYIDASAVVIGDVEIGERSSVWPNVTIRGDVNHMTFGRETNIQDNTACHSDDGFPLQVGDRVTVGHSVMLHGCVIEDDVVVGIGSVVLNGARVGKGAVIAAGSLVPEGAVVEPGMLVMGVPAKPKRAVTEEEKARFRYGCEHYAERAGLYKREMGA